MFFFFFMLAVTIIGGSGSIMGGRQSYAAIYHARHSPVRALDDGWNTFTQSVCSHASEPLICFFKRGIIAQEGTG